MYMKYIIYGVIFFLMVPNIGFSIPHIKADQSQLEKLDNKKNLITCTPLTTKEVNAHLGSNNPIKKLLFKSRYKAYSLTIINPTAHNLILQSPQCLPKPLTPTQTEQQLSQSMTLAPWLIGIGWTTTLTAVIGFATIPSILFGATLIIAGVIGMNNNHVPPSTAHTIKHLLMDGTHDYLIQAFDKANLIIILPAVTPTLKLATRQQDMPQAHLFTINLKKPL
jgi:hypothetical protein